MEETVAQLGVLDQVVAERRTNNKVYKVSKIEAGINRCVEN